MTWIVVLTYLLTDPTSAADVNKIVIPLEIPAPTDVTDSAGGIFVADIDEDGRMEVLVTVRGHLAVVGLDGNHPRKLWTYHGDIGVSGQSESQGLPGHHGPGVAAGDVDGDGKCEVIFFTRDGTLHVVEGATGKPVVTLRPPAPKGTQRWEVAMIADFRGVGDRDILLQTTNPKGYRMGRFLAAYAFDSLVSGGAPIWTTEDFTCCAHNTARLADIDGDGRDEVLGADILGSDGKRLTRAEAFQGHMDSVFSYDVIPDQPGLEVVLLEEGSNYVQLLAATGPVWRSHFRKQEPQNAVVGRFAKGSDAMYVWCRSRYERHQKPFVFDSVGKLVAEYAMDDVAPDGWTDKGVEVIHVIDWTGDRQQLACAKARHESGDVCLFEPLTGRFILRLSEKADRLYVADVLGDWREEILVLAGSELHIYVNTAANPRPDQPWLWADRNYRRRKHCHNYYSP